MRYYGDAGHGTGRAVLSLLMAQLDTQEFPPLLPVGLHSMTVLELRHLCVCDFRLSQTRHRLMTGLERAIQRLLVTDIVGELWVDGSFLTCKIDPGDVDVTRVWAAFYESSTEDQKMVIDWFNGGAELKAEFDCHAFAWIDFPEGHARYWDSEWTRAYWTRQWGFSRSGIRKGIAVIKVPHGVS